MNINTYRLRRKLESDPTRPRIVVVGSTMVDLMAYADRLPERGETVRGRRLQIGFGGKGANQAVMAALLGAEVAMVNRLGTDVFADQTIANFRGYGVDVRHVRPVEDAASGLATVWVEPSGDNRIIILAGANERLTPEDVDAAFDDLPPPDVVLCQLEVPQASVIRAFERARAAGALAILNPAPAAPLQPRLLEQAAWLVPNEPEMAGLAEAGAGDLAARVRRLGDSYGCGVVVTLGERGALVHEPGAQAALVPVPAPAARAVDTTGAGDAFLGAFAFAIARGHTPVDAARFGCACATASVARPGTQTSFPRGAEVDGLLALLGGR